MEHELSVIRQHVNDLRVAHMELSQMDPSVHTTASVLVDDMGRCVRDLSEAAKCIRTAEGTLHRLRGNGRAVAPSHRRDAAPPGGNVSDSDSGGRGLSHRRFARLGLTTPDRHGHTHRQTARRCDAPAGIARDREGARLIVGTLGVTGKRRSDSDCAAARRRPGCTHGTDGRPF